jgi:hypothetical protein
MKIQNLTLDEEKTNLLINCIDMARRKGKEILLINLFKTEFGDTITINPKDFSKSVIEVCGPDGTEQITLGELRKANNEQKN